MMTDEDREKMKPDVKTRKILESRMAQLVPVKGRILISPVAGLGGEEIRILVIWTITIVKNESKNLVKGNLVLVGTERTEEIEGGLELTRMGNEVAVEAVVDEVEEEEVALDVDVDVGNMTDTVEVTKRKLNFYFIFSRVVLQILTS